MKLHSSIIALFVPLLAYSQGTKADYDRANNLRERYRGTVLNERVTPNWIDGTQNFWFTHQGQNGAKTFMLVTPGNEKKAPAFDHKKVAEIATKIIGKTVEADFLPLSRIDFTSDLQTVRVQLAAKTYQINLKNYEYSEARPEAGANGGLRAFAPETPPRNDGSGEQTSIKFINQSNETLVVSWLSGDTNPVEYARIKPGADWESNTYSGHLWLITRVSGERLATYAAERSAGVAILDGKKVQPQRGQNRGGGNGQQFRGFDSPDGKWRIAFRNDNAFLLNVQSKEEKQVSQDGTPTNSYNGRVWWSPDSKHVAFYQTEPEERHPLNIVLTTPKDQFQPRLTTQQYLKPGDKVAKPRLRVLDPESGKLTAVDEALYSNPFDVDGEIWLSNDQFAFRYNQRGHQVMRLVGVDAKTGVAKTLIDEVAKTFVDWTNKAYYQIQPDKKHAIWMSERSGWCQLYYYDLESGESKPITKGNWVVRSVTQVDQDKKQIWFMASGLDANQDPYNQHFCRVNFDGTGFTRLTDGNGTHTVDFSPDRKVIFDTYSRIDAPPTFEVRSADTGKKLVTVDQADITALIKAGFKVPIPFVSKARDGVTDIYGLIYLPTNFDATKQYPVIEDIYAGPQGSFVPKTFHTYSQGLSFAELGFIVVKIDGLGTNNRSKAFHDVCWKNLVDAGLPDRILWMKSVAKKWPQMDLSKVGIYGTSAGGQNALDAVLTHGDFYRAAMADCGCYDNRMDKIWWNEQWMSWPIGPHYEAQSGRTLAKNLTGKLLLLVGENDTNVDPASTYQVVDALIKADKDFEFVVVPNQGHGAIATPYGRRRTMDFFVRSLLGAEPRR